MKGERGEGREKREEWRGNREGEGRIEKHREGYGRKREGH